MRRRQFRIELNGLRQLFRGFAVESVRGHYTQSEIRAGIRRILGQRLTEEGGRFGIVEALVQQHSPAHLVESFAARRLRGPPELFVRLVPGFQAPETFGAEIRIATSRQILETRLRLRRMPVLT